MNFGFWAGIVIGIILIVFGIYEMIYWEKIKMKRYERRHIDATQLIVERKRLKNLVCWMAIILGVLEIISVVILNFAAAAFANLGFKLFAVIAIVFIICILLEIKKISDNKNAKK